MSSSVSSVSFSPSLPIETREPGIYTITRFEEVISGFQPNTLGLFDVDECTLKNSFSFSSYVGLMDYRWRGEFERMLSEFPMELYYISQKIGGRNFYVTIMEYFGVNARLKKMEKTTDNIIKYLQENGHGVFTFTARGTTKTVRQLLQQQLKDVGIDFSQPKVPDTFSKIEVPIQWWDGRGLQDIQCTIADGLMCTQGTSKKDFLTNLFLRSDYFPERIVFIDDRLRAVEEVGEAAGLFGIPYVGFHYSRLKEKGTNCDLIVTNLQFEAFLFEGKILRGQEVLDLAAEKKKELMKAGISEDRVASEHLRAILGRIYGDEKILKALVDSSNQLV